MKRWMDRMIRREDWLARAVRLGLDGYGREFSTGAAREDASPPRVDEDTTESSIEVSFSIP